MLSIFFTGGSIYNEAITSSWVRNVQQYTQKHHKISSCRRSVTVIRKIWKYIFFPRIVKALDILCKMLLRSFLIHKTVIFLLCFITDKKNSSFPWNEFRLTEWQRVLEFLLCPMKSFFWFMGHELRSMGRSVPKLTSETTESFWHCGRNRWRADQPIAKCLLT
jgi:hypothetical protein